MNLIYCPLDLYLYGDKSYQISYKNVTLPLSFKIQDSCQSCPVISAIKLLLLKYQLTSLSTALTGQRNSL